MNHNVFEKALIIFISKSVKTHDKQFGFKSQASCAHAIFVMKQVIKYAKRLNCRIYLCTIDCSKAFDKVIRIFWWKMILMGDPILFVKVLMAYYNKSIMKVLNSDEISEELISTEGKKQGGPISPDLFKIFADQLAYLISSLNCGIKMGEIKVDIIQYADGITLVATSKSKCQTMINVCFEYGKKYGMMFNPDKTLVVVFNLSCTSSVEEKNKS